MLRDLLVTVGIILGLMALWIGVQNWAKRIAKLPKDCDLLKENGRCLSCYFKGRCQKEHSE